MHQYLQIVQRPKVKPNNPSALQETIPLPMDIEAQVVGVGRSKTQGTSSTIVARLIEPEIFLNIQQTTDQSVLKIACKNRKIDPREAQKDCTHDPSSASPANVLCLSFDHLTTGSESILSTFLCCRRMLALSNMQPRSLLSFKLAMQKQIVKPAQSKSANTPVQTTGYTYSVTKRRSARTNNLSCFDSDR